MFSSQNVPLIHVAKRRDPVRDTRTESMDLIYTNLNGNVYLFMMFAFGLIFNNHVHYFSQFIFHMFLCVNVFVYVKLLLW